MSQLHILVCGASGSGKSSWIKRVATGMFPSKLVNPPFATEHKTATKTKVVLIDGEPNEAKGFDGVVIMGDASNPGSFKDFTELIKTSREMNKCPIVLVANKSDLAKGDFRCPIDRIAVKEDLDYFYISTKEDLPALSSTFGAESVNYYSPMQYFIDQPTSACESMTHKLPSPALRAQEFNRRLDKDAMEHVSEMDLTDD